MKGIFHKISNITRILKTNTIVYVNSAIFFKPFKKNVMHTLAINEKKITLKLTYELMSKRKQRICFAILFQANANVPSFSA